jgi:hypothetical protein
VTKQPKRPNEKELAAWLKWARRFYKGVKQVEWSPVMDYDRCWLSGYRAAKREKRK